MGGNAFKIGNVTLWLLAIAFFVYSLWLPYRRVRQERSVDDRRRDLLWRSVDSRRGCMVVFFRVYQIATVPPEPFSDHAEKILDIYDITQGQTRIFFPRNTGREAFQMYWTVLVNWVFGTGLSFMSLKIGTVIFGLLTLPYMYLLGREIGGYRVGLLALLHRYRLLAECHQPGRFAVSALSVVCCANTVLPDPRIAHSQPE